MDSWKELCIIIIMVNLVTFRTSPYPSCSFPFTCNNVYDEYKLTPETLLHNMVFHIVVKLYNVIVIHATLNHLLFYIIMDEIT
jgi:hypothetical protein